MRNQTESILSILSFNILYGGTHFGQPLNQTATVIETARADVVVLCEHMGNAQPLADLLALHCHEGAREIGARSHHARILYSATVH